MAGPKKNKFDDAPKSKTARASAGKKGMKAESFKADADIARIVPLCKGEYAYVLDPRDGKTHHVRVNSAAWDSLMVALTSGEHAPRIQKELDKLGWSFSPEVSWVA